MIFQLSNEQCEAAIERFQEFLKFETVSAVAPSTGAYVKCAAFLFEQLSNIPVLKGNVQYLKEAPVHSPVVIAKWTGKDDTLPILLLNSHYDVVPVNTEKWTVPAFEGIRKDGNIYGRGTQDMKCVCMQYIEAIRLITTLQPDFQPERSIYLSFVPDEEIGGSGMAAILDSDFYKSLPNGIALALDEGLASTTNTFDVFYGERLPWWIDVTATGPTGHGSRFIEPTAVGQLMQVANKALEFRKGQRDLLFGADNANHENCAHAVVRKQEQQNPRTTLGDVTTLNITTFQAGVKVGDTFAFNCVPPIAKCSFDIRISPKMDPHDMKQLLDTWCQECSVEPHCQITWSDLFTGNESAMKHAITDISSSSSSSSSSNNPWYESFRTSLSNMGCTIDPQIFPAATDSRFLRLLGIRALGFSPMRNTKILLHEDNEYIPERCFLEGIGIYYQLIQDLGNFMEE